MSVLYNVKINTFRPADIMCGILFRTNFELAVGEYKYMNTLKPKTIRCKIVGLAALLQLRLHPPLNCWLQWIGLGNRKTRQYNFKSWDFMRLILEVGR